MLRGAANVAENSTLKLLNTSVHGMGKESGSSHYYVFSKQYFPTTIIAARPALQTKTPFLPVQLPQPFRCLSLKTVCSAYRAQPHSAEQPSPEPSLLLLSAHCREQSSSWGATAAVPRPSRTSMPVAAITSTISSAGGCAWGWMACGRSTWSMVKHRPGPDLSHCSLSMPDRSQAWDAQGFQCQQQPMC